MTPPYKKQSKVLFLVGGNPRTGLVPSSRFRVYSYLPYFESVGNHRITVSASIPSKSFYERYFFKKHPNLGRALMLPGFLLMFMNRLRDVVRSPFYDAIVIQRPLFPGRPFPFLELAICALNRKVVFDFDDAIFMNHHEDTETNFWGRVPFLEDCRNVERIINHSAHVIAGNEFLARFARKHNKHVSIVPTPIDTSRYVPKQRRRRSDPTVVIGWIGTSGNLRYVEEMAPLLRSLNRRVPFVLHIVCNPVNRRLLLDDLPFRWIDWTLEGESKELAKFDIGIMPLPDRAWERGKCGFKLLQYMACGIPAVASPIGVNLEIIQHGENGYLAHEDEDWERLLEILICNPALRDKFARNGRSTVEQHYSINAVFPLLVEVLRSVAKT